MSNLRWQAPSGIQLILKALSLQFQPRKRFLPSSFHIQISPRPVSSLCTLLFMRPSCYHHLQSLFFTSSSTPTVQLCISRACSSCFATMVVSYCSKGFRHPIIWFINLLKHLRMTQRSVQLQQHSRFYNTSSFSVPSIILWRFYPACICSFRHIVQHVHTDGCKLYQRKQATVDDSKSVCVRAAVLSTDFS